jgi:hypothetical protein
VKEARSGSQQIARRMVATRAAGIARNEIN